MYKNVIPYLGASESEIIEYAKRICNPELPYRKYTASRMVKNVLYYLGRQWLDMIGAVASGSDGYQFYKALYAEEEGAPPIQPVTNLIAAACDNEHARITKKEWQFAPVADDGTPEVRAACTLGKHVLKHKLREQKWEEQRPMVIMDGIICGTAALYSGWDETILNSIDQPSALACCCPNCNARLAAPSAPQEYKAQVTQTDSIESISDLGLMTFKACPFCGTQLTPLFLTDEESHSESTDAFGRPLFYTAPKGDPIVRVVSPFELYPENGGIYVDPFNMRVCGWARPESLQWVLEHHPAQGVDIQPDNPSEIIRYHPGYGDYKASLVSVVGNTGVLDNHSMIYEIIVEPFAEVITEESLNACKLWAQMNGEDYELQGEAGDIIVNHGRHYRVTKDKVLLERPLLRAYKTHEGKTAFVPNAKISASRYLYRRSELWGKAFVDDLIGPQDRLNSFDAYTIDILSTVGSPAVMAREDMQLRGPAMREGGVKVIEYGEGQYPSDKPEILQGAMPPGTAWTYRDLIKQEFHELASFQAVEQGEAPQRIRTTSALVLASEQAGTRRAPREAGLGLMCESMASHFLHMLYALRTTEDMYRIDAQGGSAFGIKSFKGSELLAQYNVTMERQAKVDDSLLTSEAAFEALNAQLYPNVHTDPVARKKFFAIARVPDIEDFDNSQVTAAEKAGIDFLEEGNVHRPDPTIENPAVFYDVLGKLWIEDDKLQVIREAVKWEDDVLPAIADWEPDLVDLETQALNTKGYYQDIPQEEAVRLFEEGQAKAEEINNKYQAAVQAAQQMVPPQAPPPPPVLPPLPVYLPYALEDKIMLVFNKRLNLPTQSPEVSVSAGDVEGVLDSLIQFYAVIQAYRLYAERRSMAPAPAPGQGMPPQLPGGQQ